MSKSKPLEEKLIEIFLNGRVQKIPAIDKRWTEEDNRIFSLYPHLPIPENGIYITGEDKTWLELARFVQDDLQWLLSLEHHKFWSYMIYDKKPHEMLVSFLRDSPPEYVKKYYLVNEEIKALFQEIEHLVFLVFSRLSTQKESEECYIENLGEILYNNYLFTVPILLDICLIYGTSNRQIVKKMINTVITLEPKFLNDFQEIVPHFFQALTIVKDKFSTENLSMVENNSGLKPNTVRDLILYLHDSVCTIQTFLNFCAKGCRLFRKSHHISEIASFYSNELPVIYKTWERSDFSSSDPFSVVCSDLIEKTRLDFLNIVKHIFDSIATEAKNYPGRREELVDEYLNIMLDLLSETNFLSDYNLLFSVEFEIGLVTQNCSNVDTVKMNHILEGISLLENNKNSVKTKNTVPLSGKQFQESGLDVSDVKLNSLITEVKDILPHLEEKFIKECLKYYKYNTENVVAALLENSLPNHLRNWSAEKQQNTPVANASGGRNTHQNYNKHSGGLPPKVTQEGYFEYKGKHKIQYENMNDLLEDKTELNELKERYVQMALLEEEAYDDEYDDTYDDNIELGVEEAGETDKERRPFVLPRVLRQREVVEESDGSDEEPELQEDKPRRDCFVQNPAELREKREQKRQERIKRDVVGRKKGQGQTKEVTHNREFKGAHKSFMGNHNRKKQASRKMNQGMIPS